MLGDKDTDMRAQKASEDNSQNNKVPPKDHPPTGKETPPPVAPVEESPPEGTDDPHITAGKKSLVTAEVHHTDPIDKDLRTEAGGAVGRIISTRSAACDRRAQHTPTSGAAPSAEPEESPPAPSWLPRPGGGGSPWTPPEPAPSRHTSAAPAHLAGGDRNPSRRWSA